MPSILELDDDSQLAVALHAGLRSLPSLLATCATLRATLTRQLAGVKSLSVSDEECTFEVAEFIAARLPALREITVANRRFSVAWLQEEPTIDLQPAADIQMTPRAAIVVAPLIRRNVALRTLRARCVPRSNSARELLDGWLQPGRLARGGELRWSDLTIGHQRPRDVRTGWRHPGPSCDVECLLVAGLLRSTAPQTTLRLGLAGLSAQSGAALAAAERRCGCRVICEDESDAEADAEAEAHEEDSERWRADRMMRAFGASLQMSWAAPPSGTRDPYPRSAALIEFSEQRRRWHEHRLLRLRAAGGLAGAVWLRAAELWLLLRLHVRHVATWCAEWLAWLLVSPVVWVAGVQDNIPTQ